MDFAIKVVKALIPLYAVLCIVLAIYSIKYEIVKQIAKKIINKLPNTTFKVTTGDSFLSAKVINLTLNCNSEDLKRKDILLKEVLLASKQHLYPIYTQISIEIMDMSKKNCYGDLGEIVERYTFNRSELKKINLDNLTHHELYMRLPKLCSKPLI